MCDRIQRLGELYDQACDALSEEPNLDATTPATLMHPDTAFKIIDRWLQAYESHRQYALKRDQVKALEDIGGALGEAVVQIFHQE
jgi:hypothetical protein